jgi:ribonucleoside-diphosphate reductase alpha chain
MPIPLVVKLIESLTFKEEMLNMWKNGVARALKRYIPGEETE